MRRDTQQAEAVVASAARSTGDSWRDRLWAGDAPTLPPVWYAVIDGRREGPFGANEIRALAQAGRICEQTPLWQGAGWRRLGDTGLVATRAEPALQPPPSVVFVLLLSLAPLLAPMLIGLWGATGRGRLGHVLLITAALNALLAELDRLHLQHSGIETGRMGPSWLVPLYLALRARVAGHGASWPLIWSVCAGLVGVLLSPFA